MATLSAGPEAVIGQHPHADNGLGYVILIIPTVSPDTTLKLSPHTGMD
ncbi:MAG: hypothetical protein NTX45_01835 [Proteobacteria bacterium]|nr:hypothetical protein [Pseudomonadota bacterium]